MGPHVEVAHVIVLKGCKNLEAMQVGGGLIAGLLTLLRRRWKLDALVEKAGFSCFGSKMGRFSSVGSHGYTYVMILGQSALNIHTYPEEGTVSAWIITCPGEDDTGAATKALKESLSDEFQAESAELLLKGEVPLLRQAA
jgi:hypothetical protein